MKAIVNSGNRKLIGDIEEKVNPGDCVLVKGATARNGNHS